MTKRSTAQQKALQLYHSAPAGNTSSSSSVPSPSAKAREKALSLYRSASSLKPDENPYNSYVEKIRGLLQEGQSVYRSMKPSTANEVYENYRSNHLSVKEQGAGARQWLTDRRDSLGANYGKLLSYLEEAERTLSSSLVSMHNQWKYFGSMSEEDANAYEWTDRYGTLTADKVYEALSSLPEGAEKDWLDENAEYLPGVRGSVQSDAEAAREDYDGYKSTGEYGLSQAEAAQDWQSLIQYGDPSGLMARDMQREQRLTSEAKGKKAKAEELEAWAEAEARRRTLEEQLGYDLTAGNEELAELDQQLEEARQAYHEGAFAEYSQLRQERSQKAAYLTQAQRVQKKEELASASENGDFASFSGYQQTGDELYEYINGADSGRRDQIMQDHWEQTQRDYVISAMQGMDDQTLLQKQHPYKEAGYDRLTQDETGIYNYYYAKEGPEKARQYLDSIQETLNTRQAEDIYEAVEDSTLLELAFGISAGLDQWQSGARALLDGHSNYFVPSAMQIASSMVREDLKEAGPDLPDWMGGASLGQTGYDIITTSANMAPSILTGLGANLLAPGSGMVLGTAMMFASAAGNAYAEAVNAGYSKTQARVYSTLIGGIEVGLQSVLGGISALGGTSQYAARVLGGIDNGLLHFAGTLAASGLSEGLEEGLQEILTPVLKNLVLGADEDINWAEAVYSGLLGAVTGILFEGPGQTVEAASVRSAGKKLLADSQLERLKELGSTVSADSIAYQLAGKADKNTGAYTIGRLFRELGAEITRQNQKDIAASLEAKGMTAEQASQQAEIIADVTAGMEPTPKQKAILESNDILAGTLREVLIDPNTTAYQRSQGYRELLRSLSREAAQEGQSSQETAQPETDIPVQGQAVLVESQEPVTVTGFSDIRRDNVVLRLDNGQSVSIHEVELGEAAPVYETAASIAEDPQTAAQMAQGFAPGGDITGERYAFALKNAYAFGRVKLSRRSLASSGLTEGLPERVRTLAYELGLKAGQTARQQDIQRSRDKTVPQAQLDEDNGYFHISQELHKKATEAQETQITAIGYLANALKIPIYVYESQMVNGEYTGENGSYRGADGSIHIDIHAGSSKGEGFMLFTLAHELTHQIKDWNPEKFQVLGDFVTEELTRRGVQADALLEAQYKRISKIGEYGNLDESQLWDIAYEEMIAAAMEPMLSDGRVIRKLQARDKGILSQMRDILSGMAGRIRRLYARLKPGSAEGRAVARMKNKLENIQDIWTQALEESSARYQTAQKNTAPQTERQAAQVRYSIRNTEKMTLEEQLRLLYKNQLKVSDSLYLGVTPSEIASSGVDNHPLVFTVHDYRKSTKLKHNVPRRAIKNLNKRLQNAWFSFGKGNKVGFIVPDIDGDGKQLLVAIEANVEMDRRKVNAIRSVYGLDHPAQWLKNQIDSGASFVLYREKEANSFLQTYGYWASVGDGIKLLDESITQIGAESQGEPFRQAQKNTAPQTERQAAQVRLSPRGESPLEDKYYARKIDQWDGKDHGGAFRIGRASKPLLAIGIPDIDIWFDQSKAAKQLEDKKEVTKSILKKIPEILANPIAVSESYDNTVMVFGQLFDESGNPIVIALRINSTNRRNSVTQVNKIRSVGTRTHNLDKLLAEESILWLGENKKETRTWFNALGRSTPFGGTKSGFIRSLSQNNQKSQGEIKRYQPRVDPILEQMDQAEEESSARYQTAQKNTAPQQERQAAQVRYSIRNNVKDVNGNVYDRIVELDYRIFNRAKRSGKYFLEFIRNNLINKKITVYNSDGTSEVIEFAGPKDRVQKDGANRDHVVIGKLFGAKNDVKKLVILNARETIRISSFSKETDHFADNSHQWLDANGWDYRTSYVMTNEGTIYPVTLFIAKTRDGRNILYDINVKINEGVTAEKTTTSFNRMQVTRSATPSEDMVSQEGAESQGEPFRQAQKNTAPQQERQAAQVRYSIRNTERMTLSEQLRLLNQGKLKSSDSLYFGMTPGTISASGLKAVPLVFTLHDFRKSTKQKHNVPRRAIRSLNSSLQNAWFSFGSGNRVGFVVPDIDGDGKQLLIAIEANIPMDNVAVNAIRSVYGLDNPREWIQNQLKDGKEFKVFNKKEANTFLRSYGYSALQGEKVGLLDENITQNEAESQEEPFRQAQKNTVPQQERQAAQERYQMRNSLETRTIQGIGRKSVNEFNHEDITKTEVLARRYWNSMTPKNRAKSPFFRAWFGDWRAYDTSFVSWVNINTNFIELGDIPRGTFQNSDTGWDVSSTRDGVDETINKSGKGSANHRALKDLDSMLKNAVLLDSVIVNSPSKRIRSDSVIVHHLYCPVIMGGKRGLAKLYVTENIAGNHRFYLTKIEEIPHAMVSGNNTIDPRAKRTAGDISSGITVSEIFAFVKENWERFEADSSQPVPFEPKPVNPILLNEDGTPKIFYHGTGTKFTEFKESAMSSREGSYFFAENREDAEAYGPNVVEVYLTGEKLADYNDQPLEFYRLKDKKKQVEWLKNRGYDGWYADMEEGWGEVSVFSASQVKSATDNIGTFDQGNPDIRYQPRTDPILEQMDQAEEADRAAMEEDFQQLSQIRFSPRDIYSLNEDDFYNLLENAGHGVYKRSTYLPIRKTTPAILIEAIAEHSKGRLTVSNRPMIMQAGKIMQAMESDDSISDGTRMHGLDENDLTAIFQRLDDPDYIVYQKDNGRYTEIVRFAKGKNRAIAVVDFDTQKDSPYMNNFPGGAYNIVVTAYTPDSLETYLNKDNNVVIKQRESLPRRGSGSLVPSHSNGKLSAGMISQYEAESQEEPFRQAQKNTAPQQERQAAQERYQMRQDEIDAVQSIYKKGTDGKNKGKSVNEFTSSDIAATEHLAQLYWNNPKTRTKSPFFRAWFGDWRAYDKTPVQIANKQGNIRQNEVNEDTGWAINVSGRLSQELKSQYGPSVRMARPYESLINDIVRKAVLLDSYTFDEGKAKSINSLLMHRFYAVADIGNGPVLLKLYVEEMNDPKSSDTAKRTYHLLNIENQQSGVKGSGQSPSLISQTADIKTVSDLFAVVKSRVSDFNPKPVNPTLLNADGTPKVFYHGTPNGDFTVFRNWQYFTDRKWYGDVYQNQGASSNGYKTTATNPTTYEVYLAPKKIFDTRNPKEKRIFMNEFFRKRGNGTPLSENRLPDWTDGDDLIEFFDDKGYDYDAIVLDEGGSGGYGDKVTSRGISLTVRDSTAIKSSTDNIGTFDQGNPDIRYQPRTDPILEQMDQAEEADRAAMEEDFQQTKQIFQIMDIAEKDGVFTRGSVNAVARKLIEAAGARKKYKELTELLTQEFQYLVQKKDLSYGDMEESLGRAVDWLMENRVPEKDLYAQEVLQSLRGQKFYLDDQQKAEAEHLSGSYLNFRRALAVRMVVSDKANMSLDSLWHELNQEHPAIFPEDVSSSDMPRLLLEAIDSLKEMDTARTFGYDTAELQRELMRETYDGLIQAAVYPAEAGKLIRQQEAKLGRLDQKHQAEVRKILEKHDSRMEQLKKKQEADIKALKQRHKGQLKQQMVRQEERELRRNIHRTVNQLNSMLMNQTKNWHIPEVLKMAVVEALEAVNMDTVSARKRIAELERKLERTQDQDRADKLRSRIRTLERMGGRMDSKLELLERAYAQIKSEKDPALDYAFDEGVLNQIRRVKELAGRTPLRDMDRTQLEAVEELYRMILTRVRTRNEAFATARRETISAMGRNAITEVEQAGSRTDKRLAVTKGLRGFFWNNEKPIYAFERIGSDTLTSLFKNVRRGEDVWARDVAEGREFYQKTAEKYHRKDWDAEKAYRLMGTNGQAIDLNLQQVLTLYAYSKREQSWDHLEKGGFQIEPGTRVVEKTKSGIKIAWEWTTAQTYKVSRRELEETVSKLTAEQRAYADDMQRYLSETMGAKGNEVSMKLYGTQLFKDRHYFPLKSSPAFLDQETGKAKGEKDIKEMGFTNQTQEMASGPVYLRLFEDAWADHVNDMSMYHGFTLPLEDLYRVLNYREGMTGAKEHSLAPDSRGVTETIQSVHGKEAVDYIRQLLKDLNGGAVQDPRETAAKRLVGRHKRAAVMASLSVIVQQPTSLYRAMAMVDPKYFGVGPIARGLFRTADIRRHKAMMKELKAYAPVAIVKEMGYFDTNIGRSARDYLTGREYGDLREKVRGFFTDEGYRDKLFGKLPGLADELAWVSIWEAVKREQAGKGYQRTELLEKSGERFTEVIMKTQVYDSVLSRSANMRSKSVYMSMATTFMGEATAAANMIEEAVRRGWKGDKKYTGRVFAAVLGSNLINSALVSIVYAMRDDDEDETFAEKYLSRLTTEFLERLNPLTYLPFAKDLWDLALRYDVERSDMALVSELVSAAINLISLSVEDTDSMDETELEAHGRKIAEGHWALGDILASLLGFPVKNLRRDLKGSVNLISTLTKDSQGRKTTAGSLMDRLWADILKIIPMGTKLFGEDKDKQVYDAILDGDRAYVQRIQEGYASETAYHKAVRKGLKENDSRIDEAARLRMAGNISGYTELARAIIKDGFAQDDVVSAINSRISELEKDEETAPAAPKAKALFDTADFAAAIAQGDWAAAETVREEILHIAQTNGKTPQEAEKSFVSSAKAAARESFLEDGMTSGQAEAALQDYLGLDAEEARAAVLEWEFEKAYGIGWADKKEGYLEGSLSREEAFHALTVYGRQSEEDAEQRLLEWDFEKKYGVAWEERKTAYLSGWLSRRDLINGLVARGQSQEEAEETVLVYDWHREEPEQKDITAEAIGAYYDFCYDVRIGRQQYYQAWKDCQDFHADYRDNGRVIANSRRKKVFAYIDGLPLAEEQKSALALAFGYAESSVRKYAPW